MLFIRNDDTPGLVGEVGTILGKAGQNIANFHLGRTPQGDSAVCLISLDSEFPKSLLNDIANLDQVKQVKDLHF